MTHDKKFFTILFLQFAFPALRACYLDMVFCMVLGYFTDLMPFCMNAFREAFSLKAVDLHASDGRKLRHRPSAESGTRQSSASRRLGKLDLAGAGDHEGAGRDPLAGKKSVHMSA